MAGMPVGAQQQECFPVHNPFLPLAKDRGGGCHSARLRAFYMRLSTAALPNFTMMHTPMACAAARPARVAARLFLSFHRP